MNRVPLRSLRSLRLTTALTAVATRPTTRRCRSGRPDPTPRRPLTTPPCARPSRLSKPPRASPGASPSASPRASPEQAPEPAAEQAPDQALEQTPERVPGRLAAGLFGAVTVVPALLAAAWLLPGLPLLLEGRLTAPPLVFMFSPLAVGLCYFALRQQPARWPGFRTEPPQRAAVPWWAVAATVAVAAGFAVWQIAERTQQVIVLGDPATYLQTASWIARHGSLPIPYSPEAFGGTHPGLTFASASYYPAGSGLAPAVMAGTPLVLAAAIWLGGVPAALVITPLIGACAVLSFGGLAGRLVGARWAPAAAAALALSLPEQYTSRGTFSEPLVQVLLFGGLCLLIDALLVTPQPAAAPAMSTAGQDRVLAALAGLVLGLTVLVRIDALSDILPAVPLLGLLLAARRRQGIPFGLGLAAGVGYGLADGYLLSRPYLDLVGPSLRPLGLIAAAVVVLTLAALAATRSRAVLNRLRRLPASQRLTSWLPLAAAAATVAVFAAFAVRPLIDKTSGQYDQNSLYWVIWYIGLPAVLLGAFGLAVLASRGLKSLLTWTDPRATARTWALPLLIALWVIVTVLWRPAISPEQPWASRRLVPFVLPGLILGAIWASAWLSNLAAHGRGRRGRPARPGPGHLGRGRLLLRGVAAHPGHPDQPGPRLQPRCLRPRPAPDRERHGVPPHRPGRARRGRRAVRGDRPGRVGGHPRLAHRRPVRPGGPGHVRHPDRHPGPSDRENSRRRAVRHRAGRPPPGAHGPGPVPARPVRRRATGGGQPADHAGGARPDRAGHPNLAHPVHGVAVRPGRCVRIALIGPAYPDKGGGARHTTELAYRLAAAGHNVIIESWRAPDPVDAPDRDPYPRTYRRLAWYRPDAWIAAGRRLRSADLVVFALLSPAQVPSYLSVLTALALGPDRPRTAVICHTALPRRTGRA